MMLHESPQASIGGLRRLVTPAGSQPNSSSMCRRPHSGRCDWCSIRECRSGHHLPRSLCADPGPVSTHFDYKWRTHPFQHSHQRPGFDPTQFAHRSAHSAVVGPTALSPGLRDRYVFVQRCAERLMSVNTSRPTRSPPEIRELSIGVNDHSFSAPVSHLQCLK